MVYVIDATWLWLTGRIRWRTLLLALRERPAAVCGRGAAFIICRKTAREFGPY
jgi:hypothetical protein